jgi:hypothetical protein
MIFEYKGFFFLKGFPRPQYCAKGFYGYIGHFETEQPSL